MTHRPHDLVGVGSALVSLSLTHVRERSAERRYVLVCTLRCHVPCGHAASRRSTCGVFHPGTVSSGPNRRLLSPRSGRLSPPFIRTVPAFFRRQPFVLRADGN